LRCRICLIFMRWLLITTRTMILWRCFRRVNVMSTMLKIVRCLLISVCSRMEQRWVFQRRGVRVKKKMMIKVHCSLLAGCLERSYFSPLEFLKPL
jgi:hypothetical protein